MSAEEREREGELCDWHSSRLSGSRLVLQERREEREREKERERERKREKEEELVV